MSLINNHHETVAVPYWELFPNQQNLNPDVIKIIVKYFRGIDLIPMKQVNHSWYKFIAIDVDISRLAFVFSILLDLKGQLTTLPTPYRTDKESKDKMFKRIAIMEAYDAPEVASRQFKTFKFLPKKLRRILRSQK